MGGRGGGSSIASKAAAPSVAPTGAETQILGQLRVLMLKRTQENSNLGLSSNWISLATLRESLPNISREDFDRGITKMSVGDNPVLSTIPVANRKSLQRRHWDGGVDIGGEISHVTRIREQRDL